MKLAFLGFRHSHVMGIYEIAQHHPGITIVGACDEHPPTIGRLRDQGKVRLTHDSYARLLADTNCDAVVIGDYYGRRGEVILQALSAGKHVLVDKPICTRLSELDAIEKLVGQKKLSVNCILDMHILGALKTLRQIILEGRIGDVQTINFTGHHPLLLATRPAWYFEEGKHGGILNDIAIHAVDYIEWATGHRIAEVVAARTWNLGRTPAYFQEAGQMMLRLENGAGVLGDVSYLAPDKCGYQVPQYWRIVVHGTLGVAETQGKSLSIATHQSTAMEPIACPADEPAGILDSFMSEAAGHGATAGPSTGEVLRASRVSLLIQQAADGNLAHVEVPR